MKKIYVNSVLTGVKNTLETMFNSKASFQIKAISESPSQMDHVTTMVGITKDLRGHIYFTYTDSNAKKLASKMMMGMTVNELDEMSKSALSEFHNMSMGGVCSELEKVNKITDITPPTFMMGENIQISSKSNKNLNLGFEIDGIKLGIILNVKEA